MSLFSGQLEQIICDAINIIVDKKVKDANYDRMVSATVVSQNLKNQSQVIMTDSDQNTDEYYEDCYKVRYQNSTFVAYPININETYNINDVVLVLIPNNDMRNEKYIMRKRPKRNKFS
jgi:hypothetical protein